LARPLLLTIAIPPLLTISAGFESIEMYPADAHIARYAAAAILPNHQLCESNFMVTAALRANGMPVAALHLLEQFVGPARRKMTGRIGDLENCGTHGDCAEWSTNRWIPFVRPRTIPGVLLQALGLAAAAARPPVSSPGVTQDPGARRRLGKHSVVQSAFSRLLPRQIRVAAIVFFGTMARAALGGRASIIT
jgi:hypothetical protein